MIVCVFTAVLFPPKLKTEAEKIAEENYLRIQRIMLESGKKQSISHNTTRRIY